jgi:hypothetical protein
MIHSGNFDSQLVRSIPGLAHGLVCRVWQILATKVLPIGFNCKRRYTVGVDIGCGILQMQPRILLVSNIKAAERPEGHKLLRYLHMPAE